MEKPSPTKIYSRYVNEDPWVEFIQRHEHGHAVVKGLRLSRITGYTSLGAEHSYLDIADASSVLLAIGADALRALLDTPHDGVVDLKPYYEERRAPQIERALKDAWDRKKEEASGGNPVFHDLGITAMARASKGTDFVEITFCGKDLAPDGVSETGSIHGGRCLAITFGAAAQKSFGLKTMVIEGTRQEMASLCDKAVQAGEKTLDLRAYSMEKFQNVTPAARRDLREKGVIS